MIKIREAIIVEGKYDVEKVKKLVDTVIISTGGFRVFKDSDKIKFIRNMAEKRGILILTDSDGAGFVIRNYLKGSVPKGQMRHAYIPEILGKEKRKAHTSKEGLLGVEGVPDNEILKALRRAGATIIEGTEKTGEENGRKVTKADLYELGLSGIKDSARRREKVLNQLELPKYLTANALLEFLNSVSNYDKLKQIIKEIEEK